MTAPRADGAVANHSAGPATAPPPEPSEAQMMDAVIEAARFLGWRVAHFRAARTRRGWRTPVQGDGVGFPDCVLVHPPAGFVWWVELKTRIGKLSPEQERWGRDLIQSGEVWKVVRGRAGLTALLDDMAVLPRMVTP